MANKCMDNRFQKKAMQLIETYLKKYQIQYVVKESEISIYKGRNMKLEFNGHEIMITEEKRQLLVQGSILTVIDYLSCG